MAELTELLDLVPHPLAEIRVRGERHEVSHLNPAAAMLYGYRADEAHGLDVIRITATPPAELAERRRQLARTGRWTGEAVHLTRDGARLQVEVTAATTTRGDPDRYVIAVIDVTGQRGLTQRLAEQSALLELAPVAILARDAQRRITFWNRAAEITYGHLASDVLGRQVQALLRTQYPVELDEIERAVERDGIWEGELVQTTRDGRRLVVDSRWAAVRDRHGRLTAMLEVNRDATDRIALQEAREAAAAAAERERLSRRLVRSQRLESLGELAGGIAHDFNNLLAVIAGYATTLGDALDDVRDLLPPRVREAILTDATEIASTTQRAAQLTRQLLTFAGQEADASEPVVLNDVISDLRPLLTRTIGEHVRLELDLDEQLRPIAADPGQLGQVLVNLAVNARDAMPDGGRLVIETRNVWTGTGDARGPLIGTGMAVCPATEAGDAGDPSIGAAEGAQPDPPRNVDVLLTVTDTGCGMEPEVLEHAFDPFFSTKPVGVGTGLGLSGVYGIVVNAGGQATLYSEPGHGTTFRARFPALGCAAPDRPPPPPIVDVPPARAEPTILVVEDQAPLRTITARILERAGYRVLTASSGPEALEIAAGGQPIDLLLTDVVMPEMLGQRLAEAIRETRPRLRVVFASGFARPALEQSGRVLDGPLLQKPFSSAELLSLVARELEPR